MTPAVEAGVAVRVADLDQVEVTRKWNRESITNAIREWVATYGQPPRAADWNPSSAKWSGQTWRIERYRKGRADGSPWPSLNAAKRPFDGSLNAAIQAAGFQPAKPGPMRRSDASPELASRLQLPQEIKVLLDAAIAEARNSSLRARSLEKQLMASREKASKLRAEVAALRRRKPRIVRELVVDTKATAKAERASQKAQAELDQVRAELVEVRRTARCYELNLSRTMASAVATRTELNAVREELAQSSDERAGLLREIRELNARNAQSARPADAGEAKASLGSELIAAQRRAVLAERAADLAQRRAAQAERALAEALAPTAKPIRPELPADAGDLVGAGPAGPGQLAEAISQLAKARRQGSRAQLSESLRDVAAQALGWRELI